jgi:cytochrome c biogenesis protein ResB
MKIKNSLFILIVILALLVGSVIGTIIGVQIGQRMIFEGIATALSGSNTDFNVTINLNETEMVNQINKTIVPQLKDYMSNYNCSGIGCENE